jgi:hypothetical protein
MPNTIIVVLQGDAQQLINSLNKSEAAVKGFEDKAESGAKKTSHLSGEMAALGRSLIAPLAITSVAYAVKQWADESEALARTFGTQKNLLTNLLGSTGAYNQAMAEAAAATQGLVDKGSLAQGTFLLLKSNLAENAAEAGDLALKGQVLSQTYEANGASFEKFLRLMQQGSPILLDNFALTLGEVNARKELVTQTEGLTGTEAKLVAIKQLLSEEGQRVLDAMTAEQRTALELDVAMKNLQLTIGEQLVPAYNEWRQVQYDVTSGVGDAVQNISGYLGLLGMLSSETAKNSEATVTWADSLVRAVFPFTSLIVQSDVFGSSLEGLTRFVIENAVGYEALAEKMGYTLTQEQMLAQANQELSDSEAAYQTVLLETIKAHNDNALAMGSFVDEAQKLRDKDQASAFKFNQELVKIHNKGQEDIRKVEADTAKEKDDINKDYEKRRQDIIKNANMFDSTSIQQRLDALELERVRAVATVEQGGKDRIAAQQVTIDHEKQMAEQARAEEQRAQEKHMQDLLLKMTLQRAEAAGELERLTGVAGITAEDAFAAAQAGMLNISDALSREVGVMGNEFNAGSELLAKNQEANSIKLRQSIEQVAKSGQEATGKSFLLIQQDADKTDKKLADVWDVEEIEAYRKEFGPATDSIIGKLEAWRKKAYEVEQQMKRIPAPGSSGGGVGMASGGSFIVPPGFPNDSFPMYLTSGEQVSVTPSSQVNNFNLNVQSSMPTSSVVQDFQSMMVLAGLN